MRTSNSRRVSKPAKAASTYDGLRLRIQGAPIGFSSQILVQKIFDARSSLSEQQIKQLESLLAGLKANGELT
jgi:hypothetical protein